MRKIITVALFVLISTTVFTTKADLAYGSNITIFDGQNNAQSTNPWYSTEAEDNEVEPGNVAEQAWDLEGFFFDGSVLTMVGGFDFANGKWAGGWNEQFTSGDIFIDIDGDVNFGAGVTSLGNTNGYQVIYNTYGYDYAIDLEFTDNSFTVYSINSGSLLRSAYFRQNDQANPWAYVDGGDKLTQSQLIYKTGLSDNETGFLGGTHNSVSLNLSSFLGHGTEFTAHFTMGCGNDNLMGKGIVAPEPASMILMGIGLLGIGWGIRKKTM